MGESCTVVAILHCTGLAPAANGMLSCGISVLQCPDLVSVPEDQSGCCWCCFRSWLRIGCESQSERSCSLQLKSECATYSLVFPISWMGMPAADLHDMTVGCRLLQDTMISHHEVVENGPGSDRCQVVRWIRSFPFSFIKKREYIIARRVFRDTQSGCLYGITKAIEHPRAAHASGIIRMDSFHSMWRSRTIPDPNGTDRYNHTLKTRSRA